MENVINKILIKLPKLNDNSMAAFPILTILSEEFPKAELNAIIEEGDEFAFNFLPFKVRVFTRPSTKKNLIETHHFVANHNDIFNIDLFFDFENTFNSAFIGFNFRATVRVGFELGWNKHLLTHKFKRSFENDFERQSIFLLESYLGKNFSDVKISNPVGEGVVEEKIDQLFKEPEPPKFILIMLDNFSNVTKDIELWKSFFDSFEKQKFIIWTERDEDIISEIFAKIDLERNELYMHKGYTPAELNYIFRKVYGIITTSNFSEALCGFYNLSQVSFVSSSRPLLNYHYFRHRPLRIFFKENKPVCMVHRDEEKTFSEMNEVVDFLHFNFKL